MKKAFRPLALLMACLLALGLLAACGGAASSAPAADAPEGTSAQPAASEAEGGGEPAAGGTVRVVTFFAGSDQWAPVWKEVIADYEAANPGVTIVDESQPTSGANDLFRTKIQSDIAANTPPDLMLFFNGADGDMAIDSEMFVDWTPYLAEDTEWSSHLKESPLKAGYADGIQYCLPYIGYFEGLFYNKALFDQYELAEPTSWENILACLDTFNENGIVPFATSMAKPTYLVELFLLSQVGAEGQKNYFDPSWGSALEAIKELYDNNAFPPDAMTLTEDDIRVQFTDGKAAMMINGSWTIAGLRDNPDMRIIAMPTLPNGKGGEDSIISGFGSGWYMSKQAAERDNVTLDFLKYMTSPETMTRFIAVGGSPAVDCPVPEGISPLEISAVEMLNKATYMEPAADSQVVREAWLTVTEPGIQYIVEGQKTPAEILEEAKAINESA